jgi:hypothetical protein
VTSSRLIVCPFLPVPASCCRECLVANQLCLRNGVVGGNARVNHGFAVPVDVTGSGHELISGLDKRNGRRQPVFGGAQLSVDTRQFDLQFSVTLQLCTKIIDSVAIAAVAVSAVSKRVTAIAFAALFQSSAAEIRPTRI